MNPPEAAVANEHRAAPENRAAILSLNREIESQEQRRQLLLEKRKNARLDCAARARKLLMNEANEESVATNVSQPSTTPPTLAVVVQPNSDPSISLALASAQSQTDEFYASQFMNPEPFQEVPSDLDAKWLLLPAPAGQRCLIIAARGVTVSRLTSGHRLHRFSSALPGGGTAKGQSRGAKNYCILDCVFVPQLSTYFILDLLAWNGIHYWETEAEFRFYCTILDDTRDQRLKPWLIGLRQKMQDVDLVNVSPTNAYVFRAPPIDSASKIAIVAASTNPLPYSLSTLLFYHKEAPYTPGVTPLVLNANPTVPHQSLARYLCS